jgi:carbonic anhydrase/acetyltransferase-like protein (isoleucine patch superfamily)
MKAYLFRNEALLYPFRKTAAQLRLKGGSVRARLIEQIKRCGLELVERDQLQLADISPGSLVLSDNLLVSDNFFSGFVSSLPNRKGNYQAHINMGRMPMFSQKNPTASFRALPVYFYGEASTFPGGIGEGCVRLDIDPNPLYSLSQGIPARMHNIDELRIYFLDCYAVPLEYWFDIQTGCSLYSREFVAKMLAPAAKFLPSAALHKVMSTQWLVERGNVIGKNCRIHPTAILEGCIIGDNVEIGPFSYLRSVVVDDNVSLREKSSIKTSYLGAGSFIMGSDIVNCYIGAESSIFTPLLYNVVFGEKSFISGGSGFADFNVGGGDIIANIRGEKINTGLNFLGSCVGDNCFLGANLIFAAGQAIPDGTRVLDNGLVKSVPVEFDGTYVVSGSKCIQIPDSFLGAPNS